MRECDVGPIFIFIYHFHTLRIYTFISSFLIAFWVNIYRHINLGEKGIRNLRAYDQKIIIIKNYKAYRY